MAALLTQFPSVVRFDYEYPDGVAFRVIRLVCTIGLSKTGTES